MSFVKKITTNGHNSKKKQTESDGLIWNVSTIKQLL